MNSCAKGKRFERSVRDLFREAGYLLTRRGRQYSGSPDSPDVVVPELPWLHVEAKNVERLNITEAMAQSVKDAGDKVPTVWHKRRADPECLVTMRASDWLKMIEVTRTTNLKLWMSET